MKPICQWCQTNDRRNHKMCQRAWELEQEAALPNPSGNRTSLADQFPGDKLESALIDAEDLLARIQVPYFLIGDMAKQLYLKETVLTDGLDIAVRKNELTETRISTLKTLEPNVELTDEGFSYNWQGIPVRVHIVDSDNEYFKRPDYVWYNAWQYQIPNPFKEYLTTI